MEALITALEEAFSGYVTTIMGFLGNIIPVVLPVAIVTVVVMIGLKVFKRLSNKA